MGINNFLTKGDLVAIGLLVLSTMLRRWTRRKIFTEMSKLLPDLVTLGIHRQHLYVSNDNCINVS